MTTFPRGSAGSDLPLQGRRILITGPAGQVAFPVTAALAADNDVWGIARFGDGEARRRVEALGARTAAVDLADPDWTALPDRFDHVVHFAADITGEDYDRAIRINAEGTGLLMTRFADAASCLVVSSSAVYDLHPDAAHPLAETDPLGDSKPLFGKTYPVSKIAQEAVARATCRAVGLPTTIARLNLSYGPNGGLPAYQLDWILAGEPVPVSDEETFHNPFHQDDIVASVPRLLDVASVPAVVTNWAGDDTVTMREYVALLGELAGEKVELAPTPSFIRSRAVDVSRQQELIGPCSVNWREGMRRLVEDRLDRLA